MRKTLIVVLAVVVLSFLLGMAGITASFVYAVERGEYAYVTRFGRHVRTYDGAQEAGLHWKWPWPIESVQRLDRRLQLLDLPETEMLTHDPRAGGQTIDKNVTIGAYVCWRIVRHYDDDQGNPRDGVDQFIRKLATLQQAQAILEKRIIDRIGAEISQLPLDDLVSDRPGRQQIEELRQRLLHGKDRFRDQLQQQYGVEIVDIRLRRFNHPASVRNDIFARIISERKLKVADYEGQGKRQHDEIISKADKEKRFVLAEAESMQKRKRAEAEVQADALRNQAQGQDPQFYAFLRKLEAYQQMLGENKDMLLLSSKNELFDLLLRPPRPPASSDNRLVNPEGHMPARPAGNEEKRKD